MTHQNDPIGDAIETLRSMSPRDVQARGYHFEARHFYSAQNDIAFLEDNRDLWHDRALPQGIVWDLEAQLARVERIARHHHELGEIPRHQPQGLPQFHWDNPFWTGADACVQYGALRELKPQRVVEIGCGWSSMLMARALARNAAEGTPMPSVTQIDPYPRQAIMDTLPSSWQQQQCSLQRAPIDIFESLDEGDVCFYDGSHVVRTASDVVWFFSEVLPVLRPGVVIHVHDIFWPGDYPDAWVLEQGLTWNEQYLAHAFLMYNDKFEILVCNSALAVMRPADIDRIYADSPVPGWGCSLWIRRR